MWSFDFNCNKIPVANQNVVCNPLPKEIADNLLLTGACHIDHEGFDLNEIEQSYYQYNNVSFTKDSTWYKDGGQDSGTNAIIHTWFFQKEPVKNLVIDHSHVVFRYPIVGSAREQVLEYSKQRPELLRILSSRFKCGLDLCIDYFNEDFVEPVVHIEWDFDNNTDLQKHIIEVETTIKSMDWIDIVPSILRYNSLARKKKIDAFTQADTRSLLLFGEKSYKLIPTI